jgi:hypothetical protein
MTKVRILMAALPASTSCAILAHDNVAHHEAHEQLDVLWLTNRSVGSAQLSAGQTRLRLAP